MLLNWEAFFLTFDLDFVQQRHRYCLFEEFKLFFAYKR
jgi:hypothetical protein